MPTLLTWNYVGVHCAEAGTEEPQRLYPGDIGLDDVFGEVVIQSNGIRWAASQVWTINP